jgi:hypothetical protein
MIKKLYQNALRQARKYDENKKINKKCLYTFDLAV